MAYICEFPVWTQLQEVGSALSGTNIIKGRRLQKLFTQSLKTRLNLRGDDAIASSPDQKKKKPT